MTRRMTPLPAPPTRIGGCGRCLGLGQDQIGSKSTWRPWYWASSWVQITRIACTRSSMTAQRVGGSMPWLAISSGIQPTPTPEQHASVGEDVEAGDSLGCRDRVACGDEADAGSQPQGLRRGGGVRQGGEGVVVVGEARLHSTLRVLHQLARLRRRRDVGVVGEEQRLEAALLDRASQL